MHLIIPVRVEGSTLMIMHLQNFSILNSTRIRSCDVLCVSLSPLFLGKVITSYVPHEPYWVESQLIASSFIKRAITE